MISCSLKKRISAVKKELHMSFQVENYLLVKKQISQDNELKIVSANLKKKQTELVKNLNNESIHNSIKREYDELQKFYNEHPLVQNYESLRDELSILYCQISEMLSL